MSRSQKTCSGNWTSCDHPGANLTAEMEAGDECPKALHLHAAAVLVARPVRGKRVGRGRMMRDGLIPVQPHLRGWRVVSKVWFAACIALGRSRNSANTGKTTKPGRLASRRLPRTHPDTKNLFQMRSNAFTGLRGLALSQARASGGMATWCSGFYERVEIGFFAVED